MFENTVKLSHSSDGIAFSITETSILNGPVGGKTERSSADGTTQLTIGHIDSKENGAIPTQRSNVRISLTKSVADTTASATGYVQFTSSIPKTEFTVLETQQLVAQLINFLRFGANAGNNGVGVQDADWDGVERLYGREP